MVLIAAAFAAPTFEAEASMGRSWFPLHPAIGEGHLWRAQAGAGLGAWHLYGQVSTSLHQAEDFATQVDTSWFAVVPGDFTLLGVGPGLGYEGRLGRFRFGGRGELGVVYFQSLIDRDSLGKHSSYLATEAVHVGGEVGASAGLAIIPERAWFNVHGAVGWVGAAGLGLSASVRVGVAAAL